MTASADNLPLAVLTPLADLHPAPWNPRFSSDERFRNLCRSLEADPGFLWRRPILAQADGTIYAGNLRYRAAEALGLEALPAIVEDVPDTLAKQRALRDNQQWGDWEDEPLRSLLADLVGLDAAIDTLGFTQEALDGILAGLALSPAIDPAEAWQDMPAFEQTDTGP